MAGAIAGGIFEYPINPISESICLLYKNPVSSDNLDTFSGENDSRKIPAGGRGLTAA